MVREIFENGRPDKPLFFQGEIGGYLVSTTKRCRWHRRASNSMPGRLGAMGPSQLYLASNVFANPKQSGGLEKGLSRPMS